MWDKKEDKKQIFVIENWRLYKKYPWTINYHIDHVIDNDPDVDIIDKDKTKARSYLIKLMDAYGVWSEIKLLKMLAIGVWLMFFMLLINTYLDNSSVKKINTNLTNQKIVIQALIENQNKQSDVISWFNYIDFQDNQKSIHKSLEFIINKQLNEKK